MSRRSTRRNYSERVGSQTEDEVVDGTQLTLLPNGDDDEVDEEDELEVTRCVCGNDDLNSDTINPAMASLLQAEYQIKVDQGLFIQCDKCSVWQHGYCVGLFTNDDVPDKYWCELCKPDLHIFIHESSDSNRTLYRPVNEKRKKLIAENDKFTKRKFTRKDRRSYDYDEQLQKALRESAKESGIPIEEQTRRNERSRESSSKESKSDTESPTQIPVKDEKPNEIHEDETNNEIGDEEDEVEGEEEGEEDDENSEIKKEAAKKKSLKRAKRKEGSRAKPKKQKTDSNNSNGSGLSKEELINQSSKPRFVNDKSSIYELRKRISAILEWLSRSQLELGDEKELKSSMTNDVTLIENYEENLGLMQSLTVKILNWEEKYGKYAP
ncbi:Histone deacetylase complex subunit [Yamadazyma tenuis]|uniref:Histone deacetylase complex subunit n=1 Tax=Candida tenuis TaxID=2315449 RepID=UPI00279D2400|nr:Histone deacetylase complex subunit [Yamadazyma tenuis]